MFSPNIAAVITRYWDSWRSSVISFCRSSSHLCGQAVCALCWLGLPCTLPEGLGIALLVEACGIALMMESFGIMLSLWTLSFLDAGLSFSAMGRITKRCADDFPWRRLAIASRHVISTKILLLGGFNLSNSSQHGKAEHSLLIELQLIQQLGSVRIQGTALSFSL